MRNVLTCIYISITFDSTLRQTGMKLRRKRTYFKNKTARDERLYITWKSMKYRCYTVTSDRYKYYGGKGVTICDEWKDDFIAFYAWAKANGYRKNLTIDRIDSMGNYEPSNCQWVTQSVNSKRACYKVFPIGSNHPKSKLNESQVLHIRQGALTTKEYSLMYNVSTSNVSNIKRNLKRWPHVNPQAL